MNRKAFVVSLNRKAEYQGLLGGIPRTCGMRSGRVYLKSGESCGLHSTKQNEETLVFLEGQGEVFIGEDTCFKVASGQICYIPPHTEHNVKNAGDGPFVYIYCVAPVENCHTEGVKRPENGKI